MKYFIYFLCGFNFMVSQANATAMGTIIQVARRLRMSYSEPVPPKDYFIDLGERDGLKVGDRVEVYRYVPVPNRMASGDWHVMKVTLGELKIKQVGESTSVARYEREREINSLPAMEYQSLMLGDQVILKTGLPFK
ncbi:MAG: hypothetical protein ACKOA8_11365 [Deltaproteobacteria bacterium]